jgi:hypothetical protein
MVARVTQRPRSMLGSEPKIRMPYSLASLRVGPRPFRSAWTLALVIALLAFPATAAAEGEATPSQLHEAEMVAANYWGQPACGWPIVVYHQLGPGVFGVAVGFDCAIALARYDWIDNPETLCETMAHEWGHLVLGPKYFAAVNPGDPEHSPDPNNIMYASLLGPRKFAPCIPMGRPPAATMQRRDSRHHGRHSVRPSY